MGVVYQARQTALGRVVALKMILSGAHAAEADLARFRTEAEAIARLQHPNIVQVFEVGQHGGLPYIALEYCPSGSLETKLSGGPLPAREAAELVETLARAMAAAHEKGVIHRDLKPANVLLAEDGTPKITDFGLAKKIDEASPGRQSGEKLTATGAVMGTPSYMAPEQAGGKTGTVGPACDVYALGAILYECLTGRPPFQAATALDTMMLVLSDEPVPVTRLQARTPRDLDAVVLKCLEKDPRRRYGSARELAEDLQRFLKQEPVRARPAGPMRRLLRRVRRRPGVAAALVLAVAFTALAAFGSWYWDSHYRLKVEYYNQLAWRWGLPEGIGRLSEAEARHRSLTWKLSRRGNRVEKIEAVNGLGFPTTEHSQGALIARADETRRECSFEYRRNEQGEVIKEIARDRAERVVWVFHFSNRTTGYYADHQGIPRARGGTGAAFVHFVYSPEGFAHEIHYLDKDGKPQANADAVFVSRGEFDPRGLPLNSDYFGPTGKPIRHKDGYARVTWAYDKRANQVEAAYFDEAGRPVRHKDGNARATFKYDAHGNLIEAAYFDEAGQPVRLKDGYARSTWVYDDRGNLVETAYFDEAGQRVRHRDGYYARLTAKVDDHGNRIEEAYFDEQGRPTRHRDGEARVTWQYDDRDNQVEAAYFDEAGQPLRVKDGYAAWTARYDERGYQVEMTFLDEQGQPTRHKDGNARVNRKYDDRGNQTELAYFDETGQPARVKDGFARVFSEYDERGNLVQQDYFDEKGRPTRHADGYARMMARFDDRGNQIEMAYFDEEGRPMRHKDGYARVTSKFDDRGNPTQQAYFDEAGKPVKFEGYVRVTWEYDDRGRVIAAAYFDDAGKPTRNTADYARQETKYDDGDRPVEEAYFDEAGKPILNNGAYARWTAKYDAAGNQVERRYFDAQGKPVHREVVVAQVEPGGQAERLGLKAGDVFASYGGREVNDSVDFEKVRSREGMHDEPRELIVLREGQRLTFRLATGALGVTLEERKRPEPKDGDPGREK